MTETTAKLPRKPRATKAKPDVVQDVKDLDHAAIVFDAVITLDKDYKGLVAAIKDAPDQKPIKFACWEARVMLSLDCSRTFAKEVVDNKHNDDKACVRALSTARQWTSALYKKHDIKTDETRGGGNRGARHNEDDEMETAEIKFPKAPKVTTRFELQAWVLAQAQSSVDFFAANEEHDTVACEQGHALWGACKDFLTSVQEIGVEYAPTKEK